MGCDIHPYIEYFYKNELAQCVDTSTSQTFGQEIFFGRNYTLFGLIAGVRSGNSKPPFPPKGIPTKPPLSIECCNSLYTYISDDIIPSYNDDGKKYITRQDAEDLFSFWSPNKNIIYADLAKTKIITPGYHSMTYLSLPELLSIRKLYLLEVIEYDSVVSNKTSKTKIDLLNFIEKEDPCSLMRYSFSEFDCKMLYVTLSAMLALEKCDSNIETRFVCWFDS